MIPIKAIFLVLTGVSVCLRKPFEQTKAAFMMISIKACNGRVKCCRCITNEDGLFAKWLSVITQKEINNKAIIENACEEEAIFMAAR